MSFVLDFLQANGPSTFLSLARHMTDKIRIIVTVIAILELVKNKILTVRPAEGREDILLQPAAVSLSSTSAA
jgi:chromatin segregation and condensation protein Rec8/ScpA/Scc1 (kleisin family)